MKTRLQFFADSRTYPGFLSLFLRKKSNQKSRPKTITAVFGNALIGLSYYCNLSFNP